MPQKCLGGQVSGGAYSASPDFIAGFEEKRCNERTEGKEGNGRKGREWQAERNGDETEEWDGREVFGGRKGVGDRRDGEGMG